MPTIDFVADGVTVSVEEHDEPRFDRELDAISALMRWISDDEWLKLLPDVVTLPDAIRLG